VRILTSACAFGAANVTLLTAPFVAFGELSAAWVTAGYALALVASGLTALETGRRSQVLAVVWLRGWPTTPP
jgi:hypothetical protein